MQFEFEPPSIEDDFYNERELIKIYGKNTGTGIVKVIGAIVSANNAYDLYCVPQFKMHLLKGERRGVYSLSPDNKSRWRILIKCIDENGTFVKPYGDEKTFLKKIKKISIERISNHYD